MRKNLYTFGITTALVFITTVSLAEITAKDGIERLKINSENAKANLESYKKNLVIVEENLAEIAKAKTQTENERAEVNSLAKTNQNSLTTLDKQEKEIAHLISQEDKEAQAEELKVKELEKLIVLLKMNQEKRGLNETKYKQQLEQVSKEKQEWKNRQDQLAKQQKEMNDRLAAVKKSDKDWSNKKRGYEGEINRWQKESEKHEKLYQQYSSLAR